MRHLGYDVEEAVDGIDAVERARLTRFDLVLLDERMPRLRGIEALQALKTLQPHMVLMIITAYGTDEDRAAAARAGAAEYLQKPLDLVHLKNVVCAALGEHPPQQNNLVR